MDLNELLAQGRKAIVSIWQQVDPVADHARPEGFEPAPDAHPKRRLLPRSHPPPVIQRRPPRLPKNLRLPPLQVVSVCRPSWTAVS